MKTDTLASPLHKKSAGFWVVLTGNPNCGKTTLFNALTGLRAKVGNYAGVTVERKEGTMQGAGLANPVTILDLPGTYSLSPQSPDEQIARDVLFRRIPEVPCPHLVVVVIDASNLQRNLYYATQVIELGYPVFLALNMVDVAQANGHEIDVPALSAALGIPVYPLVASNGEGLPALRKAINERAAAEQAGTATPTRVRSFLELPEAYGHEVEALRQLLTRTKPETDHLADAESVLVLGDHKIPDSVAAFPEICAAILAARGRLEAQGIDWRSAPIEARYARASAIQMAVTTETALNEATFSDRLDQVLTHRIWGTAIFIAVMGLMFQSIFWLARFPMDAIQSLVDWTAGIAGASMPPGALNSLLTDGAIKGVGAVVVFLPQICLLFLFISLLEDTGYMARAAFLMDRLMSKVGLHGKSFIPMLSSFACAIPGIMATRTIETAKDRLVTIMVAPLISCSARLPVYTLLIAAAIPTRRVLGIFGLPGLTLLGMYLLGIVGALGMAWFFKKTLLKGEPPLLILELPPYKRPVVSVVCRHMWDRSKMFLRRAGTVILGINILLWFLATYPHNLEAELRGRTHLAALKEQAARIAPSNQPAVEAANTHIDETERQLAGERLRYSFAGRLGHFIEPTIRPLGFDWKIGIGIVASFAAREVFVSTMSVVYNVGDVDTKDQKATESLAEVLRSEKRADGRPVYTALTAVTLMVFYVFALQCVSTVAIVRRETNSWKWPALQWIYMTGLAWVLAFACFQGGRLLGFS
ncbi:MAG TPA: ferrous iron transport protein B [Candidatus Limnocylindria bacterium]|jgi:ferrous iron transport protein B|nr:ferrous iron transport protein B [Candidatus Limnocylindria bacterium]